jgi:thiamine kinase-like enzyme
MTGHTTPESVLSQIPGWEEASWRELEGCVTNRPYLVEANGQRAVLKIDMESREPPFNSRRVEAKIQRAAREAGLASNILYVTDTVLMTEYVDGVVWSLDCLENEANLESLANALRKLHSLPLTGRTFDTKGAARSYATIIGDTDAEKVAECLRKVDAGPQPHNLCCCHNDLVVANIINTPETRFLDWEYACDNDPFFDLATIVAHHKLTSEQSNHFLDAYFDGDGARWQEQLSRQADVYEALLYLWTESRTNVIASP